MKIPTWVYYTPVFFALLPASPTHSAAVVELLHSVSVGDIAVVEAPGGDFAAGRHIATDVPGTFSSGTSVNTIIGADRFYAEGFNGQGTITANVEAGHIWNGHESLNHVTSFSHSPAAWNYSGTPGDQTGDLMSRHPTWVGGHIGGRLGGAIQGEWQRGIAENTDLRSGAIATGWASTGGFFLNASTFDTAYRTYFGTADVINSSWGGTDAPGTSFFSVLADALADQNTSTTFVVSAGNRSSPNTVGFPGSGYNSITVGALENGGDNSYSTVASFSSRGPQDWSAPAPGGGTLSCSGCRAVVDIVAPGTNLTAPYYGGQTGSNNPTLLSSPNGPPGTPSTYTHSLSGTSFASPITAGGVSLLYSASKNTASLAGNVESRDARVMKAVLLNSADKIPGWDNGQSMVGSVIQTTEALDFASGAGALNLDAAYDQFVNATQGLAGMLSGNQGSVSTVGWDLGEVVFGTDNIYSMSVPVLAGTTMTVTLDWFRDRSETFETTGTAFDNAQADLDLFIRDMSTNLIIAESISGVNVVEHLHVTAPTTSFYQLEVKLDSFLFDTSGIRNSEQYGIAWHATAVPEPSAFLFIGLLGVGFVLAKAIVANRSAGRSVTIDE